MDLVRWLVASAAAGAVYTGWRMYRYPGGWAFAFNRTHAGARADLDRARRQAGDVDRAWKTERADARRQLERERLRHRERARAVERRIAALRRPGRGSVVGRFGGMTLHEHSVELDGHVLPLAGLKVRLAHAQHQHVLYLAQLGGRVRVQRYARGDHDEDTVRGFAKRLESAVADENAFRIRVAAQLEEAEEELARARGDTRAQEEAQARVAGIEERRRNDTRRQTAQKELDAARDRWSRLTGKRPR